MSLKVLHIIPLLSKGGAERLVLDICIELSKRQNVEVKLISFSDKNEYLYLSEAINYEIIPAQVIPSILKKSVVKIDKLLISIQKFNPNIIHTHLFEAEIISRWLPLKNISYITHCHDNMKQFNNISWQTFLSKEKITNYYEKLLIINRYKKSNNHFIAISNDTEQYYKQTLPPNLSENIHTLPNSINFNRFYNPNKKTQGINKNQSVKLISVGSLVNKKNQIFLIDVVNALHLKKHKVFLDLLGDGPNKTLIDEKILNYKLQKYVSLKGNVEVVEDYLHNATIYVHSALYEPFGLALLEAMATGLPVVCLDGKGNRDIISNGVNGFMVYEQNADLFAEKIIELINNRELYISISNNAVEFARKHDIKEYVDKLMEIYFKLQP